MDESKYRYTILAISIATLSMMLANLFTLNFTIICMTEEKFRWENFTIHFDAFERGDFDPPILPSTKILTPTILRFDIPAFRNFNGQTFTFSWTNHNLFIKIMKLVFKEESLPAAKINEKLSDLRNIHFVQFADSNITDYNPQVVYRILKYILMKLQTEQNGTQLFKTEAQNDSDWRNLNVTHIELTNITWNGKLDGRIRVVDEYADYYYTNAEQIALFTSVALGSLVFIFPVTQMINGIGVRKVFSWTSFICISCNGFIPMIAPFGFYPFLILQFIKGIGLAACFPAIGAVTSNWAKISENGLFNCALTSSFQLGPGIAFLVSGMFCHLGDWEFSHYVLSMFSGYIVQFFALCYRDHPREHDEVSSSELDEIQLGKEYGRARYNRNEVSYGEIYKNKRNWAIWIAALGNMFGFFVITFSPIYFRKVLQYPYLAAGVCAALPTFFQFILKPLCGKINDKFAMGENFKIKFFNSIAFFGMAMFFIILALFASSDPHYLSAFFFTAATTILGFNSGGFFKASTLISQRFSYFVNAHLQFVTSLSFLLVIFIISVIAPNNHASEWSTIFYIFAGILVITNIIFIANGVGKPPTFTDVIMVQNDIIENNSIPMD